MRINEIFYGRLQCGGNWEGAVKGLDMELRNKARIC